MKILKVDKKKINGVKYSIINYFNICNSNQFGYLDILINIILHICTLHTCIINHFIL